MLVELLAETRGRSDEQRAAIETLAGKVATVGADMAELEKRIAANEDTRSAVPPDMIRRIWARAFAVAFVVAGVVAAAAIWGLRR